MDPPPAPTLGPPPHPHPPGIQGSGAGRRGPFDRGKGGNVVRANVSPVAGRRLRARRRSMDPCRSWGALALLCLLLPGGHLDPCRVSIAPRDPVVEFGASLLLNCTSSCRNSSRLDWEVSVTKVGTRGPGWVSLSIPNVTDWRLKLYCYGIFGDHRPIAATTIYAYRFSPPQIYLEGDTVAGKETRVTCDVSARVAPPDPPDLRLTLTGGGLPPSTQRGSRLGLVFTARPEQHGREVTCEATLRLGGRTLNASTAATLWVWAAPHHVRVQASRTVFAAGDNLTVTCQAEGNPPPRLRWELPARSDWELRDDGATVTLPAARRVHGGTYRCLAQNRYGTGAASVDILFQGSSRSLLIPVAVTLAVVTVLAAVAGSWWLYRARGWKPMPDGSQPS